MTTYTIKRRDEETECSYCAYPLMIDDKVHMSADEREVYCSKACAGLAIPESMFELDKSATFGKRTPKGVTVGCFDV